LLCGCFGGRLSHEDRFSHPCSWSWECICQLWMVLLACLTLTESVFLPFSDSSAFHASMLKALRYASLDSLLCHLLLKSLPITMNHFDASILYLKTFVIGKVFTNNLGHTSSWQDMGFSEV